MFKSKKGISELAGAGLGVGVFAIILAVVALILVEFQGQTTADTTAYNITGKGIDALWTLAKFMGVIALAVVAGYLIVVVVRSFRVSGGSAV